MNFSYCRPNVVYVETNDIHTLKVLKEVTQLTLKDVNSDLIVCKTVCIGINCIGTVCNYVLIKREEGQMLFQVTQCCIHIIRIKSTMCL